MFGPQRIIAAFALTIGIGAALLHLPTSSRDESLPFLDAAFLSTSAVCVTGLSTIDISEHLTRSGQGVLLVLFQLGGLGITTVSTFLLVAAGRATLAHAVESEQSLAAVRVKPLRLLWWVLSTTLAVELAGALALGWRMGGVTPWWNGLFHSVSAFCNAGFTLYPDSLIRFRGDTFINLTMMTLIAVGGLGFIALRQVTLWLFGRLTGRKARLFLHTRVVLLASVLMWTGGALAFGAIEWPASLAASSLSEKALAAAFQSVTARTAGFNTIDIAHVREPTLYVIMFLMFIGGAPGGCAGGIKLTTAVIILAAIHARVLGRSSVHLLRRSIDPELVRRSFTIAGLAVLMLFCATGVLLFTEERWMDEHRADRLTALAFESVSAFGTVGLTTGETPSLSSVGKCVIMICMFVGRLGPLLVAVAVLRDRRTVPFDYPREDIAIG